VIEKKIFLSEDCLLEDLDEEIIALNLNSGEYFELNKMGKEIIHIIKTSSFSTIELIQYLKERFNKDIEEEALNFLGKLEKRGIIEIK